jgi:hypothetical protein
MQTGQSILTVPILSKDKLLPNDKEDFVKGEILGVLQITMSD